METIFTDSKQTILDAAEVIIAQSGYGGLSMRELSRESGLAKSTLYHYFHDKHEIYVHVIERDMLAIHEAIAAAANIDGDPIERLHAVIKTQFRLLNERGDIAFHALRRAGGLDDQLLEVFRQHRSQIIGPIIEVLDRGIQEGLFRPVDTELTVMSIFGLVNGFYAQQVIFGETSLDAARSEDEVVNHTLSLLLDGIRM